MTLLVILAARADGALTNVVSFAPNTFPYAGLAQGRDGSLYGVTQRGGDTNKGVIFEVATNGDFSVVHSFKGVTDGSLPYASLLAARDGNLYGTTTYGGHYGFGTVFRFSPDGSFTNLHSFTGNDGAYPFAPLMQARSGLIYGTTASDTNVGCGTIFLVTTNGLFVSVHNFTSAEGVNPYGALVQARDGNLYGTTVLGGPNSGTNFGTIFRFVMSSGAFARIHSFAGGTNGAYPYSGLVAARDGYLYGVTSGFQPLVGAASSGTIFRVSTAGALTNLYSFTGGTDGANPYAALIQASDGALYGTTSGGTANDGSIFKITTDGVFTPLVAFNGGNGSTPYAALLQAADGNLHGTTTTNGPTGGGTVFQYSLSAPPFFFVQPVSRTINNRVPITFTAMAGGTGPLSYRWLRNSHVLADSANITGANTPTLSIAAATGTDAGNYTVIVSNPYGQIVSTNALLSIVVVRPTITIVTPAPNGQTSNDVTLVGKAKGKYGVDAVYYRLNDGDWFIASTTDAWTNWSAAITPLPGTNVLRAYAIDADGRVSVTNTEKFFHNVLVPVAVHVSSGGSVRPSLDGRSLAIGRGYAMTALPARGFAFRGWSGTVNKLSRALSFIMQPGFEVTATFEDIMRPRNRVVSPRPRQHFTTDLLTVNGKARDNAPGVSVIYQLNGAAWSAAQTTNSFTNWTAQLTLAPGTNIIRACAIDAHGLPSLTNTVMVLFNP